MTISYHNIYGTTPPSPSRVPPNAATPPPQQPPTVVTAAPDPEIPISNICHLTHLPNELILHTLNYLTSPDLLPLATTCHRLHLLTTRLLHARLKSATALATSSLILECYPPSQKLTAPALECVYTGTPTLDTCLDTPSDDDDDGTHYLRAISTLHNLYCYFRPQRREWQRFGRAIPGDIPGSRTHVSAAAARWRAEREEQERVKQQLSLEGHELFIQLEGNLHLVRAAGFVQNLVAVHEGYVRIWRDWLGERACAAMEVEEMKTGEAGPSSSSSAPSETSATAPSDPSILWLDSARNVGLRVRVRELKWRRNAPVLMYADEEIAVSYEVTYDELLVRTAHLVHVLERSAGCEEVGHGKAVVFGTFA